MVLVTPARTIIIPVSWLAIIEGIQDYEYLRMLRDRVDATNAGGAALEGARTLLATLPGPVAGAELHCEAARLRVLDALGSLEN